MIRFACPLCQKMFKASTSLVGREVKCSKCGSILLVPEPLEDSVVPIREVHYGSSLPESNPVESVATGSRGRNESGDAAESGETIPEQPPIKEAPNDRPEPPIVHKMRAESETSHDLKYCHECGERIRVRAEICPKCGVRQPELQDMGINKEPSFFDRSSQRKSGNSKSDSTRTLKYCQECGERIRVRAVICPNCGVRQAAEDQAPQDHSPIRRQNQAPLQEQMVAGILAVLVGCFGVHKFYLGYNTAGIIMLVVSIAPMPFAFCFLPLGMIGLFATSLIGIVEGVIYLTKSKNDFRRQYILRKREWF